MPVEIYRRRRCSKGQWRSRKTPYLKIGINKGHFTIFKYAIKMMGLKNNDSIMFAFNKKEKCGYVFKEEPQGDSYYIKIYEDKYYGRFTSKDLMHHMCDVFGIEDKKTVYFKIDEVPNDKGMYRFVYDG